MLKMIIRMDDDKIKIEKRYHLKGIYNTLDSIFIKKGLPRVEDVSGALVYRDGGRAKDDICFGRIVSTLKKRKWFMENVSVWLLCAGGDSSDPADFSEKDLLKYYR